MVAPNYPEPMAADSPFKRLRALWVFLLRR